MNRWFNPSHPQTLQAAVILGYFSAVFGLLFLGRSILFLPLFLGVGVGAFASANNKRWGYYLLAVCSVLIALFWVLVFFQTGRSDIVVGLRSLIRLVFPVALAAAAVHPHSREYQRVWFE